MNVIFIVLIFAVALALVVMTDLITAVQVLSILASVAVLYRCFSDDSQKSFNNITDLLPKTAAPQAAPAPAPPVVQPETFIPDGFYGPEYHDYNSFKSGYGSTDVPMYGGVRSVDDMGMRMGIRRDRSRQCAEGMMSKNANYYKYHFGDELADYENRPWWGRNEY